jgi:hypothetical protein
MKQFNSKKSRPTQISKANKKLAKNKNVVVGAVQTKNFYAVGEKTVSSVTVSPTGDKAKTSSRKSFVHTVSTRFRGQAIQEFNDWAKFEGLTLTYVGVTR